VSALGHLDNAAERAAAVADLMERKPDFSSGFARKRLFYLKDLSQLEVYLEGLRQAGVSV